MARKKLRPTPQLPFSFEAKRSYARADFVPGDSNAAGLTLIDAWPEWPARVCAIWGPKGSGKTHLARIWQSQAQAISIEPLALHDNIVAGLSAGGAFLIDGADHVRDGKAFFHLINFVQQSQGWLLMTGVEAPPRWPAQVPDLHSRLTAVPGAGLQMPDEPLLARALLKLFADRQLKLPEEVLNSLVPRLERSFADAERLVALIDGLALQQKRNISVEIANFALRHLDEAEGRSGADTE